MATGVTLSFGPGRITRLLGGNRMGAGESQVVAGWVLGGFCCGHNVGHGGRLRGSRIGCSAEQTNDGQACNGNGSGAGGGCGRACVAGCARARVRGRILRPEGDSRAVPCNELQIVACNFCGMANWHGGGVQCTRAFTLHPLGTQSSDGIRSGISVRGPARRAACLCSSSSWAQCTREQRKHAFSAVGAFYTPVRYAL